MRGFVANTDYDWFTFLRAIEPPIGEVNFWKPGSDSAFKALQPGEPLFFKLKAPHNAIGGFGYFAHYSTLPVSMAWEVYDRGNGALTFGEMRGAADEDPHAVRYAAPCPGRVSGSGASSSISRSSSPSRTGSGFRTTGRGTSFRERGMS